MPRAVSLLRKRGVGARPVLAHCAGEVMVCEDAPSPSGAGISGIPGETRVSRPERAFFARRRKRSHPRDCDRAASHSSTRSTRQASAVHLASARPRPARAGRSGRGCRPSSLSSRRETLGLDGGDGEGQRRGDLGVGLAPADGEGDIPLAWAERGHAVAGVVGAGAGVGVAGHHAAAARYRFASSRSRGATSASAGSARRR